MKSFKKLKKFQTVSIFPLFLILILGIHPMEQLFSKLKPMNFIINGKVTIPDGRGLKSIKIILFKHQNDKWLKVKAAETTRNGSYRVNLSGNWFNKKLKLIPKHPEFSEGVHFYPRPFLSFILRNKHTTKNFTYKGPLPNLLGGDAMAFGITCRDGVCRFYVDIANMGLVAAGPFKCMAKYDYLDVSHYVIINCRGVPGRNEAPNNMSYGSTVIIGRGGTDWQSKYKRGPVWIDIGDSVKESNEKDNYAARR